jgi:DNA-binding protein YbaB
MMEVFQQQVTEIDNRITLIKTKIKTTEDYLKINIDGFDSVKSIQLKRIFLIF